MQQYIECNAFLNMGYPIYCLEIFKFTFIQISILKWIYKIHQKAY